VHRAPPWRTGAPLERDRGRRNRPRDRGLACAHRSDMTSVTILIPTHRHPELLPLALRSALAQDGTDVEVFVVGDGVEDDTRAGLEPYLEDSRVRFFDFPKGARHGEEHRHAALQDAAGAVITYLSDDDLLLPGHATEVQQLLVDADFAHPSPVVVT